MRQTNIQTYAQQLIHLMGDRAEEFASQKVETYQQGGEVHEAEDWRRIKQAVVHIRFRNARDTRH